VRIELREQDLEMPPGTSARVTELRPRLLTVRMQRVHRGDSLPAAARR
jgi:hypothetical protein